MTRRSRYSLLIAGLICFIILAPVLVLYVQGKLLRLDTRRTQQTGITSIKTDPSGAGVFVQDEHQGTTPTAVRFLATGDYDVRVEKEGYKPWHKRLSVVNGHVTYVTPPTAGLFLLKNTQPEKIAETALTFTIAQDNLVYLNSPTQVAVLGGSNANNVQTITLSRQANAILSDMNNGNEVLVTGPDYRALLNTNTLKLTDITKLTAGWQNLTLSDSRIFGTTAQGALLATRGPGTAGIHTLANNIQSFYIHGDEIYYLSPEAKPVLHYSAINNDNRPLQGQVLETELVFGKKNTLFTDGNKALFVLADNTLYRVSQKGDLIASNVQSTAEVNGTVSYGIPGELWWYESRSGQSRLVSRASNGFSQARVDPASQYAFFVQGADLVALELDDRGQQNKYVLDNAPSITELTWRDQKTLWYMKDGSIYRLTLR